MFVYYTRVLGRIPKMSRRRWYDEGLAEGGAIGLTQGRRAGRDEALGATTMVVSQAGRSMFFSEDNADAIFPLLFGEDEEQRSTKKKAEMIRRSLFLEDERELGTPSRSNLSQADVAVVDGLFGDTSFIRHGRLVGAYSQTTGNTIVRPIARAHRVGNASTYEAWAVDD